MALVNPQIAMSFRPTTEYQPRNALAEYAQLQSIVGAQRQAEVADMQLQERNALRQLDPSAPDYERQLFKISPQLGLEFRKEAAATAAQRAAQQKSEFELKVAQRKFGQDLRRGLSANPSNENIVAFGQDAVLQGLYTPEQVKVEVDQLLALPIDERVRILSQAGASAAELRPQVVAPGSSLVAGGRTVFTAPDRAQSERPIAVSPGQVLVDASGRQIFTAPERAESQRPIVMSPGQVAIDASGRQIFTAPERVEPQRPMAVSPGQVVIDASGKQIFTAPAALTPDPAELRTMEALGFPRTQEGYAAFRAAQMRENQPGALVPILRNGKPVLVPREEAVGQTPFSPTSVQVLGMGPGREPAAPTITQIQDPTNLGQMITIDARRYQGGGVGSPGVIGASGKAAPAAAAAVKQEQGVSKADDILSTLESAYAQLRERKAIPSEKTNALTNIWASIAASAPGQVAGRTVGTAAQTQRDIIQSSRNQLLLAIKDATGLSAQQLNSNMELQTWLSSLTDPTRSIEANEAILQNVRRFITSGGNYTARSDAGTPPAPAPGAAAGNTVTLPNGTVMTFPNAEAAAKFKRDARLP